MPIYVGNQKIEMSGMDKVYVGTTLVWQKQQAKVLVSIAVSGQTTTFNVGDTFVFGGTVTATYSDGSTADVTSSSTFSGYNMSSHSVQTVTVSYTEDNVTATTTYQITVYKVLTKITLSNQTTSFTKGATFSFGGTVTAHYNDGSTANVTSSTTFSGYNMNNVGTQTVTASYTYRSVTKTATYNITVSYATYSLKYFYQGNGNGAGRIRVRYHKADGSWAWGTTTTKTAYQSSTITVTAAKNTTIQVQVYNDSSYSDSYKIKQTKNGSATQLATLSVSANSNKTWTSGNLNPGSDNTLTISAVY